MFQDEVDKVEKPAIGQLQKLGWRYVPGVELSPEGGTGERGFYRDVVLAGSLESALRRLNPWLSDENLRKVMREFTHPNHAGLMEYNHSLYSLLVNYLSVDQDLGKGRKGQTVRVIDFETPENNDFVCTSQFKVAGPVQNIIPDIVCFVNGLPLAVLECKSPYITDPMAEGVDQLRRYANLRYPESAEGAPRLFWYNQFMVALSRDHARVGTISASASHYAEWKDAYPYTDADIQALSQAPQPWERKDAQEAPSPAYLANAREVAGQAALDGSVSSQERLLAGMFNRASFLDLIQNFIVYEPIEGRLIKKMARYQQYRAVNRVIDRLRNGHDRKAKSGVVWHTQGSGKSLTMVMLAMKMRRDPELQQYKMVFVTDRAQLDTQLSNTFREAQDETVHNADSIDRLKHLLASDASDIVTATVQKFQDAESEADFTNLNPSEKVVVLADEAHRTQFGNLAATINAALPNAPKIGFTGTPLMKSQKMSDAFGGYIDSYMINEAVEDGATVRIIYEGREVRTDVVGRSLDALFEEYFGDRTGEEKVEIRKKYGVERAVREAPARIRWVCLDLLKHYRERIQPDGFKAMIVVGSRHAATLFKDTLDELEAPPSEVIISGDHNDPPHLAKYADKSHQKEAIANFKKPLDEDPTTFLIVKDMLLTGFDAPILQVMYLDRMLKDHTLMQAIARVNRTYKGKSAGYIVDYYGLSDHLTAALDQFSSEDVEGAYYTLKDEIPKLEAAHTRVAQLFSDVAGDEVDDYVRALKDEDLRQQFELQYKRFAKQLNVVLPDPAAKPYVPSLKFWGKVQNAARNQYHDQGLDISDAGAKVRELVEEHIISTGVDPRIPPVDLMDAEFQESVNELKSDESRASKIESAIRHHITVNLDEDPEYYKSLSQRLEEIIQQSHGKWEQQLELLHQLVGSIESDRHAQAESLGLSETEFAFYNILMAEVTQHAGEAMVDETVHDEIHQATRELVAMFEEATQIIDFFSKPDEVKRMKKQIKRTVLECSFADKAIVNAVQDRFMDLAEKKFGK
ncbi:type I restriction endonuclease subunit R [Halospina sp. K52047b]|uniref:type I restriction endonuclease subunit R n=1 Tax=Halospina sp. K52047b TaxID=2614160 RepID=UPI00124AA30C|nr:type I restriction endonuclease subunit R [Halospina sp. K52047b]KAA8984359.1 type I restriction endonuclease subunit R [Halospina sp. K52047b]